MSDDYEPIPIVLSDSQLAQVKRDYGLHVPEDWAFYSVVKTLEQQQAQLVVMREALESINHMAHNIVRKDGESNEYAVVNRLFEIADVCRQALSTTAGANYAKRVAALERVAEEANRWMNDKDEKNGTFHYMALKRELRELEALDK